jgi:hypothetical protein
VIMLLWYKGSMYHQNSVCGVWVWKNSHWNATTLPSGAPDPVASQCPNATIPSNATIFDSSGNSWTVGTDKKIYENGVVFAGTANVILLIYDNGVMYHQNNLCGVWQYAGNNVWNETNMPADALYQIPASVSIQCPGLGGIWTGTIYPEDLPATMISSASGEFFFETIAPDCIGLYSGNMSVTPPTLINQAYSVSGSSSFTPSGSGCPAAEADTFSGTLYPGSSIDMTTSDISGNTTTVYWEAAGLYTYPAQPVVYDELSSFSAISGSWSMGDDSGFGVGGLNISSTGAFSTGDASCDCTVTGQAALIDQPYPNATIGSYNMYSFTATILISVPDQNNPHSGGTETGLLTVNGNQLIWGGVITNGTSVTNVMHTLTH